MANFEFVKSKEGKLIVGIIGVSVLVLTGIHHYYRIKIAKEQLKKLKNE